MSSQSDRIAHDLKDVHTGQQNDSSHVYDDLVKLQHEKTQGQLREELSAATNGLQRMGLLPGLTISMGAAGESAVEAFAQRESINILQGRFFSSVGDLLTALKAGSDAAAKAVTVKSGEIKIAYANGSTVDVLRDSSGFPTRLTWQNGSIWNKSADGTWQIKDDQGKLTQTFAGTLTVDATTDVLTFKDPGGAGFLFKPDATRVVNDGRGRVTELDYIDGTARRFEYDNNNQITKVTERTGNTWVRDEKGVFNEYDQKGNKTNRTNDSTPRVDADGTFRLTTNKDKSVEINYTDGSKLSYDNNGNVTAYKYADGSSVDYHYTNGLIDSVRDRDNTTWKRDQGLFHQYDEKGNGTGATSGGSKFIPPTTVTNLYENSSSGIFDKLVEALGLGALAAELPGAGLNTPIRPEDVNQGYLGDCYFLSAVSSVAEQEPEAIQKMIQDNHDGTYTVTFPGLPDKPMKIQAPTQDELDRFARYRDGTYVAVLEKAHRYLTGKTDQDNGGHPSEVLTLLTGKTYHDENIHQVQLAFFHFGHSDDEVDQMLTRASDNHQEITATTATGQGPIGNHTWTVLAYDPTTKTVTLRNPWGFLGFDRQKFPSVKDLGNGDLTMSLEEFHNNYLYISIRDR